jgi:hypothetical protein
VREVTAPDFAAEDRALVDRMKQFLGHIQDMPDEERLLMLGALTTALGRRLAEAGLLDRIARVIRDDAAEGITAVTTVVEIADLIAKGGR